MNEDDPLPPPKIGPRASTQKSRLSFNELEAATHRIYDRIMDARSHAHLAGTLNAIDRSRQYTEPDPRKLLESLNSAWSKTRMLETEIGNKQKAISKLEKRLDRSHAFNITLIALLTSPAWAAVAWSVVKGLISHF